MANTNVIITRAVQYKDTDGNTVELLPSNDPQSIPADLAKEGLDRGWAEKPARKAKATQDGQDGQDDQPNAGDTGTGDGQTPAS